MTEKTCCFTGHRIIKKGKVQDIKDCIKNLIIELSDNGVTNFMCGGALGFDTLAALLVLEQKKKLTLVLPCINQSDNWNKNDILVYQLIKDSADNIIYTSKEFDKDCMLKRNRYMVDNSDYVVACFDGRESGGTLYTVNYAKRLNRKIIII